MSQLTDFQILQLAATLAAATDKKEAPQVMVKRMFECATLIRIEMGDTQAKAEYRAQKEKQAAARIEALKSFNG